MVMFEQPFNNILVKVDVTAVKFWKRYILAGIGGHLHIFEKDPTTLLKRIEVFTGQKIYGIIFNDANSKLLIFGGKCLKIFLIKQENLDFVEELFHICNDWILAAKWLNDDRYIATVFMHNFVMLWENDFTIVEEVACEEKCILYSADLVYSSWEELIVLSGTVFSQVVIWKPTKRKNKFASVSTRLTGHKGVIFSLCYNEKCNLILSTSDDRSAILWKPTQRTLRLELSQKLPSFIKSVQVYGHSSRVFKGLLLDNYCVTSGEDSLIILWSLDGVMLRKIEAHQGDPVWCLDYSENDQAIVSGGSDCGIYINKLHQELSRDVIHMPDGLSPKRVGLLSNDLVAISENGCLYSFKKKWIFVREFTDLKNYALLEVSPDKTMFALAGFFGSLYIYCMTNEKLNLKGHITTDQKSRIYSIHWLSSQIVLTCEEGGLISMFNLEKDNLLMGTFILPQSKERWTTSACFCDNFHFAVGDRKGNIFVYSQLQQTPIQVLKKVHNYLGVTNLLNMGNEITSLGRNAILKKWMWNSSSKELTLKIADKLPFSWLTGVVQNCNELVTGFMGHLFVLWDYKSRKVLLEIDCGGGHRSWDFRKNGKELTLSYVKDKSIDITKSNLDTIQSRNVLSSFHVREINTMILIPNEIPNEQLLISGGEDTTLRIHKLSTESNCATLTPEDVMKSHLSSLRTIKHHPISSDNSKFLIFSAGGREQIVLWELVLKPSISCSEQYNYYNSSDSETRIMDLYPLRIKEEMLLFAACSDGTVKMFSISKNQKYTLELKSSYRYKLKCLLKIRHLNIHDHDVIVITTIDGQIVLLEFVKWELKELLSFHSHQSGVNSLDFKLLDSNRFIFISGGDDNAISTTVLQFQLNDKKLVVTELSKSTNESYHCAQISDISISNEYFLSTSLDQRLLIFQWEFKNEEFTYKLLQRYDSVVADIKGMICRDTVKGFEVILYGKGMEVCCAMAKN